MLRELVSVEKARNDYGVIIDAQTQQVDEQATDQLRQNMAQNRGEEQAFDFGPPLSELLAKCKEETGLEPPTPATTPRELGQQWGEERSGVR